MTRRKPNRAIRTLAAGSAMIVATLAPSGIHPAGATSPKNATANGLESGAIIRPIQHFERPGAVTPSTHDASGQRDGFRTDSALILGGTFAGLFAVGVARRRLQQ